MGISFLNNSLRNKLTVALVIVFIIKLYIDTISFSLKLKCFQYVLTLILMVILTIDLLVIIKQSLDYIKSENNYGENPPVNILVGIVLIISFVIIVLSTVSFFTGGSNAFLDLKYVDNPVKETFYIYDSTQKRPQGGSGIHTGHESDFLYYERNIYALDENKNKVTLYDPSEIIPKVYNFEDNYIISYYPNTKIIVEAERE